MVITLTPIDDTAAQRQRIVGFVTAHEYPFHVKASVSEEEAATWAATLFGNDHSPYWVDADGVRIGLAILEDVTDDAPMFDLRLAAEQRGKGLGEAVLRAITDLVFATMPNVSRFEGNTREDNVAMRRTFERCGWVQEAYYREAWPGSDGVPLGATGYAMLRRDWATGTKTPIPPAEPTR